MKAKAQDYLRVKQAAALLAIAPNTLRKWGATGKIAEYRHPANRYRLYKRADIEGIIAGIEQLQTRPLRAVPRKAR